ncbi:hypothetical protein D6D25_09484 [Aureobasidium pullulans]|nr:hypothetical protein D6D25_09484 [Aureobasidium pullulans]
MATATVFPYQKPNTSNTVSTKAFLSVPSSVSNLVSCSESWKELFALSKLLLPLRQRQRKMLSQSSCWREAN